ALHLATVECSVPLDSTHRHDPRARHHHRSRPCLASALELSGVSQPVARAAAWALPLLVQAFLQPGERVTRSITSSVVNFHGETFDPGCDRPWKSVSLSRRRICRQPKVKSSKNRMRLSHTTSMKARTLWSGDHMGRRSSTMPDSAFLT